MCDLLASRAASSALAAAVSALVIALSACGSGVEPCQGKVSLSGTGRYARMAATDLAAGLINGTKCEDLDLLFYDKAILGDDRPDCLECSSTVWTLPAPMYVGRLYGVGTQLGLGGPYGLFQNNMPTAAESAGHLAAFVLPPSVAVALLRLGRSVRARSRSASAASPSFGHVILPQALTSPKAGSRWWTPTGSVIRRPARRASPWRWTSR